jgi:hypothetical protein
MPPLAVNASLRKFFFGRRSRPSDYSQLRLVSNSGEILVQLCIKRRVFSYAHPSYIVAFDLKNTEGVIDIDSREG